MATIKSESDKYDESGLINFFNIFIDKFGYLKKFMVLF